MNLLILKVKFIFEAVKALIWFSLSSILKGCFLDFQPLHPIPLFPPLPIFFSHTFSFPSFLAISCQCCSKVIYSQLICSFPNLGPLLLCWQYHADTTQISKAKHMECRYTFARIIKLCMIIHIIT